MSYKVDLHTHSIASPDGGLMLAHYRYFLHNHLLDYIAVTDHGTIDFALEAHKEFGEQIIVGQEIMTNQGEIIGLYLHKPIKDGQEIMTAVRHIKEQGGLVYVPHPFETVRKGISEETLGAIISDVDIVEAANGRAMFQNKRKLASEWATTSGKAMAASSDAHGRFGWGYTYSSVVHKPAKTTLVKLLADATYATGTVGMGIVYPKLNRLKKKMGRSRA
ncbi:MAG: PHP domain-containing protein [Candidatus Saccharimonadales bacterium]